MRLFVFVGLLIPSIASAAAPTVAVLPTRANFSVSELRDIDRKLADAARIAGYNVVTPSFELGEITCREVDCLPPIARRYNLDVILAAELTQQPGLEVDVARVILFRRSVAEALRKEEEACSDCKARKFALTVNDLATRLLRSDSGAATPPLEPARLMPTTFDAERAEMQRRTTFRALGYSSLVLFAGSVALTATMAIENGSCDDSLCRHELDASTPIIVGGVLSGVFAATTVTFLVLGYRRSPQQTKAEFTPMFSQRHVGLLWTVRF